jgi:SAM-dependent methyltransferase
MAGRPLHEHGAAGEVGRRTLRAVRGRIPPRLVRHYVDPLRRRPLAEAAFPGGRPEVLARELTDDHTICSSHSRLRTRYHYNAVENSLLEHFIAHPPAAAMSVLDVGSGAGHWIDFYRDVLEAGRIVGVEYDAGVAAALDERYADDGDVTIVAGDIADPALPTGDGFDVVNAISVMFHIVEDDRWRTAVAGMGRRLRPGGTMLVGGQFGPVTHDVGFRAARASDPPGLRRSRSGGVVYKRLRSRRAWRRCAGAAGLEFVGVVRTRRAVRIDTPESNLLVLRRP